MKTIKIFTLLPVILTLLLISLSSESATFLVTNTGDSGAGTLRQAIIDANITPGHDNIYFNISPAGTLKTIIPINPLPVLNDPTGVTIDGYTQPGASVNTTPMGSPSNAVLLIEIRGTYISTQYGIKCEAGHCTIRGLIINGFTSGTGILIDGSINNIPNLLIWGCYIGTNSTGTAAIGNSIGIQLINVLGTMGSIAIGDGTNGGRCLISGNNTGIQITGGSGVGIYGNYIGPHVNGMTNIGNTTGVVVESGSTWNFIGHQGHAGTAGTNVISGNGHAVLISGIGTNNNYVIGNYIGLNATGSAAMGNSGSGVRIEWGASNNEVGSFSNTNYRNIISGNGFPVGYSGVDIKNPGTSGNIVQGNYIGTDQSGQVAIPNWGNGVSIFFEASMNQIGGLHRNIISGNNLNGVWITNANSDNNIVACNYIGLAADGITTLANGQNGVLVDAGACFTQIGLTAPADNQISGNGQNGIRIDGPGTNNTVIRYNYIGLTSANGANGILLNNGADFTTIGGINIFEHNYITNNPGHGIHINNSQHTNVLSSASNVTGPNKIFNNGGDGICVTGQNTDFNTFTQNSIYDNGGLGIDLGNDGVTANDPGDPDTGPNDELNYPVITSAVYTYGFPNATTLITGTLDIDANPNTAMVEIYGITNCDPSGNGEGNGYWVSATPDVLGNWSVLALGGLPGGIISALTIDQNGNTSEFSSCFTIIDGTPPVVDFGDAPEGALAYPASGVTGQFPTCIGVGAPGSYIEHTNHCLAFGIVGIPVDGETDGNAGICPVFNANQYNQDECFQDGDAGLIKPGAFTITGNLGSETVVPCPNTLMVSLGNACTTATWGQNIDINVQNCMPSGQQAYFNLLIDWNQDGIWSGTSTCPGAIGVPEHAISNFTVPNGFSGLLSSLIPPSFIIGPNQGYVWARFTVSDTPVPLPWDGSGTYNDGETEDYLIYIGEVEDAYDFGDAPEGALAYPATGVIGQFPTCTNVGPPNSWVRHKISNMFLGFLVDPESDGNAGICPAFNPNQYNMDDCFLLNGDGGLLYPGAFTITGNPGAEVVVPCPGSMSSPLGNVCTPVAWGPNIDIHVHNASQYVGYVNVLFDWNHDGIWSGSATCPGGLQVPEQVLVNHPVAPGYIGPLSGTGPAPFMIGPLSSYVWARITISHAILPQNWDGSAVINDGETEDYLIYILPVQNNNQQNILVPGGQTQCFEAAQTITLAGAGTTFLVQNGAIVYLVAGNNIIMKEGTHLQSGSYVHAYIDQTGEYCTNPKAMLAPVTEEVQPDVTSIDSSAKESFFKVYPNPTTGQFYLELNEVNDFSTISVEIFSMLGEKVKRVELPEMKLYLFDLSANHPGVYLIRVLKGNDVGIVKLILQ